MKRHPDSKLTLREAYDKHYDKTELSKATEKQYHFQLNRWERLTANPSIGKITNDTIAEYRQACIGDELAAATISTGWTMLRAILRRMGKPETGNPRGLGVIELVPWMKPVRGPRKNPRRVTQDDLSLFYIAADCMQLPRTGACPPSEYWRALCVVLYFTGLRKSDVFAIRSTDVDLHNAELHFTAQKTGKQMVLPLHPCVVEHLKRIWTTGKLFRGMLSNSGDASRRWRQVTAQASVKHFTMHDLRRTAASEIDRVQPGMGSLLLQHRPLDVTGVSYLNKQEELAEAIDKMRVPLAFKHGPKKVDRREIVARKQRQELMRSAVFQSPTKPSPDEWTFEAEAFCFRGEWYNCCTGPQLRVLRALAWSAEAVDYPTLAEAVYGSRWQERPHTATHGRVCGIISSIRSKLRQALFLGSEWNPIPCIERGNGGKWTLFIPSDPDSKGGAE